MVDKVLPVARDYAGNDSSVVRVSSIQLCSPAIENDKNGNL